MDVFKCTVAYTKARLKSVITTDKKKKKTSCAPLLSPKIGEDIQDGIGTGADTSNHTRRWSQALCLLPVYLLQLSYGMNSGFPAILTPQLGEPCSEFSISMDQESWIVSLDNILTPLICITSGLLQHKFGPLRVLMFSCLPYTLAWIATAVATGAWELYLSRVLVGVSHAIISTTVYTVEVTSKEMRGTFSMMESVLRCSGTLLVYSLGLVFRWWQIAMFAPLVPILAFFTAMFVPESPVYLVSRGRTVAAQSSLSRSLGPKNSVKETEIISENLQCIKEGRERKADYVRSLDSHPEIYKPFLIIVTLSLVQQFSGVSVIRAYVVKIFDDVFSEHSSGDSHGTRNGTLGDTSDCASSPLHHKTSSMAYLSAMVIGICRLLSSLALARLLQSVSRRSMYFISVSLTLLCLLSFSVFSYLIQYQPAVRGNSLESVFQWCSLVAVCLLVISVQLGVQTLPSILSGELFPSDVRATCKGLTRSITCIFLMLSLKLYPVFEENIHVFGTFIMFSSLLFLFSPLVYWILPETKDVRLEMIQKFFSPSVTEWQTHIPDNHT